MPSPAVLVQRTNFAPGPKRSDYWLETMCVLLSSSRTLVNTLVIYTLILYTYTLLWNNYVNLPSFSSDNLKCKLPALLWPILTGDVYPHVTSGSYTLNTRLNGNHVFSSNIVLYLSFKRDLLTLKEYNQLLQPSPKSKMAAKRRLWGTNLNFVFRVKATVLSLLSCIFVLLNSQKLRCDMFRLFSSSEP